MNTLKLVQDFWERHNPYKAFHPAEALKFYMTNAVGVPDGHFDKEAAVEVKPVQNLTLASNSVAVIHDPCPSCGREMLSFPLCPSCEDYKKGFGSVLICPHSVGLHRKVNDSPDAKTYLMFLIAAGRVPQHGHVIDCRQEAVLVPLVK